jgi:RND family efflux transporter MFP subunit
VDSVDSSHAKVRSIQSGTASDERALWAEFRDAATPEAFYASWLGLQCSWIQGVAAGMVLATSGRSGTFAPAASWPREGRPGRHLATAAEKALKERRALALQLEPQGPGGAGAGGGTRTCIAQPIELDGEPAGAVVLELSPRPQAELEGALRRLAWGSAWLELSALRERGDAGGSANPLKMLLELIATPLEHEHFHASATGFVTALAGQFHCDRVSFGSVGAGVVKLRAVSHSALFDKRANLTRAIEAAMEEALDQEDVIVFPTPSGGFPQITRSHAALAEIGSSKASCSVPISHGDRFCSVLCLERNEPFLDSEIQLIEAAASLGGPMLDIQRREDRWLVAKALDAARETASDFVGPRHVALKLGVVGVVLLVLGMTLVKADFRVAADTTLEAKVLRAAVAPFDGYVAQAPARAGDRVIEGAVLAILDDRELVLERSRWSSQLEQLVKQDRQAMAERNAAQVRIFGAQIAQARAQLSLAEEQLSKTRITAPFDGIVVTGDLSQQLGAPVERGQLLYEVAPLEEYRVVLDVDERDIDEIALGQRGSLVFSAFPGQSVEFEVQKITPVSAAEEGNNTFRVEATMMDAPAHLQPGMEGVAKVDIDRRRLIWIWTHEIVDWLRLKLWAWLP